jgi:hypothetical protein
MKFCLGVLNLLEDIKKRAVGVTRHSERETRMKRKEER